MSKIVPVVSSVDPETLSMWLDPLTTRMSGYSLRRSQDLTDAERHDARVVIAANPDPKDLLSFPRLEWVQSLWAGVEGILRDVPAGKFEVARMIDPQQADTMAEAVLTWTLWLHRDNHIYARQQAERKWEEFLPKLPSETPVAILGMGHMGSTVARRLIAQGFPVMGWSSSRGNVPGVESLTGEDGLRQALSRARVVAVLLPLTNSTRGLLNAERIGLISPEAAFINFARAPIVDYDALLARLAKGTLQHAILDVFAKEPLDEDDPIWNHPRVTVLPHIAASTRPESIAEIAAQNLDAYFKNGSLPRFVDWTRGY